MFRNILASQMAHLIRQTEGVLMGLTRFVRSAGTYLIIGVLALVALAACGDEAPPATEAPATEAPPPV